MAKIPKIDKGARPSAVPRGALPGAAGGAASVADSFGALADVGYKIAADEEEGEALKLRQALEAKQAIVNEVSASRTAGDYEESLVASVEQIKKDFWENPDQAPEKLLTLGREAADRHIQASPNTAIGLEVAQKTASRLDSAMREIHNWAQSRQTQKAKGDLSIIVNRATAGAEGVPNPVALDTYIKSKEAELSSIFQNVLGSEAQGKMAEMRSGMARAWVLTAGDRDPLGTMAALDAKKGPLVDHLNVSEREALRKDTKSSFEGLQKTRELDAIRQGIDSNRRLADSFMAGDPGFAGIVFDQRRALEQQKKAVGAQMSLDTAVLKQLGIDPQGQTGPEIVKIIDSRLAFVNAIEKARRRQTAYDAPDDPASVEALLVQQQKALKSKKGRDMAAVVEFQKNLAIAISNEKVSGATAATMFKTMSLSLDDAAANAADPAGLNLYLAWRYPRVAGDMELNNQFSGQFSRLGKPEQTAVRIEYMRLFNEAQAEGRTVDGKAARRMALRALSTESETHIPGVD